MTDEELERKEMEMDGGAGGGVCGKGVLALQMTATAVFLLVSSQRMHQAKGPTDLCVWLTRG